MNLTCNSTLDDLRLLSTSEVAIVGSLNFHDLARIIAASCTLIATVLSLYLVWMHALHYTKPREQRHIIRILFMVPIYAIASFFQIQWYWQAIYFQVISDCYEAFAIASFFALLCHYIGPDLHSQKNFFRLMRPVRPWVLPISWLAKCCGSTRKGPWRTPESGLTWFNIIWIGIYHYCFIRVTMTIAAVVAQYFNKYCESSNSPVFGHIWIIAVNACAVSVAMYCVIQFYVQLRKAIAEYKPFLKVLAIKLVIFLSFWQASAISVGTSTLNIVHPNKYLAYPDLKVTLAALLLCVEMACFAILHLWAFPYAPYRPGAKATFYPSPDLNNGTPLAENESQPPSGGFLGLRAIWDALNLWDLVKAFGRGIRWLFCGIKRRKDDISYKFGPDHGLDMDHLQGDPAYDALRRAGLKSTDHLPIASEFRRSTFMMMPGGGTGDKQRQHNPGDESAGLIDNAAPDPSNAAYRKMPPSPYRADAHSVYSEGTHQHNPYDDDAPVLPPQGSYQPSYGDQHATYGDQHATYGDQHATYGDQHATYDPYVQPTRPVAGEPRSESQTRVAEALWGPRR